jgi:hypothetical protein
LVLLAKTWISITIDQPVALVGMHAGFSLMHSREMLEDVP